MNLLLEYDWPGNIRQLENICRYMTVMAPSSTITVDDIPDEVKGSEHSEDVAKQNKVTIQIQHGKITCQVILKILSGSNDLSSFSREIEKLLQRRH